MAVTPPSPSPSPRTPTAAPRPMRVVVLPGSKAQAFARANRTNAQPRPATAPSPMAGAAVHGFHPQPALDLRDYGGRIIQDLVYTNFYVGGAAAWNPTDITNIDKHLAAAMSDTHLNNVLVQYYRGSSPITTTFRPSNVLPTVPPATVTETLVKQWVRDLVAAGKLMSYDSTKSVFNFMLPRGIILTLDDGQPAEKPDKASKASPQKPPHEVEKESSSLNGLGGFHGAVHVGNQRFYYAVGVYSEGNNGIVAFNHPWKNMVATFYHELVEARTDADVDDNQVAWVNNDGEEIGDIPMSNAPLSMIMKEVHLVAGGTAPIQLMWSNAVHAPEGGISKPHH